MRLLLYEAFQANIIDSLMNTLNTSDKNIFKNTLLTLPIEISKIPLEAVKYGRMKSLTEYAGTCKNPTGKARFVFYFHNNRLVEIKSYDKLYFFQQLNPKVFKKKDLIKVPREFRFYKHLLNDTPIILISMRNSEIVQGLVHHHNNDQILCFTRDHYHHLTSEKNNDILNNHIAIYTIKNISEYLEKAPLKNNVIYKRNGGKEDAHYYLSIDIEKIYALGLFDQQKKEIRIKNPHTRLTDEELSKINYSHYIAKIYAKIGIDRNSDFISLGKLLREIVGRYPIYNPQHYNLLFTINNIESFLLSGETTLEKIVEHYNLIKKTNEESNKLIERGLLLNSDNKIVKRLNIINDKLVKWIPSLVVESISDFKDIIHLLKNIHNFARDIHIDFIFNAIMMGQDCSALYNHLQHEKVEQSLVVLEEYVTNITKSPTIGKQIKSLARKYSYKINRRLARRNI